MAKALKTAALIVGGVALIATGAGAIFGAAAVTAALGGISAVALTAVGAGLSLGASLLAGKPQAPATSPATADRLMASINLRAPRTMVFGATAMATDIRDQEYANGQTFLHRFMVVASHRVAAIREIWFDDKLAWTLAGGVQGEFAPWLTVTPVLEGSAANAINIGPRMGSSRRFTGCAYVHFRYTIVSSNKKTESVFAQSIPSRVTIIGDGAYLYDPRLDSTAGGAGAHRANDQATWTVNWTPDRGRNPALQLLMRLLGWRIRNPVTGDWKLALGYGIPPERIDLQSFIDAANLCDEPVAKADGGTEPRYRSDGIFSEADAPSLVLDTLKATMNAVLDDVDGRIRLTVLHNDLATPIGDLSENDVLGEFTWDQTAPLDEAFNIVRGSFTDPSTKSLYQQVDYPEVRADSPDGIDRIETVNLPMVQSPSQAQRLSKQRLQRMRYSGMFTATFQATAWRFQKGDVVRFRFAPLGWDYRLFRIVDIAVQVDGTVPMTLRVEHPDVYAWDRDERAPVLAAEPVLYDQQLGPLILALEDLDRQLGLILSDGVITLGREKRDLIRQFQSLEAQFFALDDRHDVIGEPVDMQGPRNAASNGYLALLAALDALNPPWDDVTQDTPVDGAALNAQWATARTAVEQFAAAMSKGMTPAEAYDLAEARARVEAISSDAILSAGSEKSQAILDWQAITNEVDALSQRYIALGQPADVAAAITAAIAARDALASYLGNLVPSWSDTAVDTPIVAVTWRTRWGAALEALGDARAAITGRPGADGLDGTDGIDGTNGQSIHIAYADSADGTANFTTGDAAGRTFIGVYTDTNPGADSPNPASYGWTRLRGLDGANGLAGPGGYVHIAYANNATGTLDFNLSDPTGRSYLGTYTDQTEADSANPAAYAWSLIKGSDGVDGLDGTDGLPGAPGANGQTSYVHFAYANSADGSSFFTTGEAGGRFYVGVYTDFTAADSGNYLDYTWSLQRGADGANGTPGAPGANGQPSYVHTAYSNAPDGSTGFHLSDPTGRTYLGVYVDQTLADSTNPAVYAWSLIKGADGAPGAPGAPGVSPYIFTASATGWVVLATYLGVTKSGQFPKTAALNLRKGTDDVLGSAVITVTPSSGLLASQAGGVVSLTQANNDGIVEIVASIGGVQVGNKVQIPVVRQLEPPPPEAQSSLGGGFGSVSNDSYPTPPTITRLLNASPSGQLTGSLNAEYGTNTPGVNSVLLAKFMYRVPGSSWADFGPEQFGTQATRDDSFPEPAPPTTGVLQFTQTASGLSPGQTYEIGVNLRKQGSEAIMLNSGYIVRHP